MDLDDVMDSLEPLQQAAVHHVYLDGHTHAETAALLAVEIGAVGAALAVAFRAVARYVLDTEPEVHRPARRTGDRPAWSLGRPA